MSRQLTDEEVERQLADLPLWTREGDAIVATIEAPDFPAAIRIVAEAAEVAEEMNHHPDIDIRWRTTTWLLTTAARGPHNSAVAPDSNAPSSLDAPMKMMFTAATRPRMLSGGSVWISV